MNRIDRAFAKARAEKRAALVVFVTGGDPDLATTAELIPELAAAGADVIELGVPHSDPIGEGPTIQASSQRSLAHHTTLTQILECVRRVRGVTDVPIVLMGYLNNVLAHGEERFAKDSAAAGVDGLILCDTPAEEMESLSRACAESGVHQVMLVAPTSTPHRVVRIAARSRGFVYCVSVTGVTGSRRDLPADLAQLVGRIRRVTPTPVCVGFGVSDAAQAAAVARLADGVIVGSALVSRIGAAQGRDEAVRAARRFVAELAAAVRTAR